MKSLKSNFNSRQKRRIQKAAQLKQKTKIQKAIRLTNPDKKNSLLYKGLWQTIV